MPRPGEIIRSTDTHAAIVTYIGKSRFERATASASQMPDCWWVDRVFVYPSLRRKGLGRKLVNEMLELIRARGGGRVVVCPGGYNMKYAEQRAFYEACGFCEVESDEVESGILEITV